MKTSIDEKRFTFDQETNTLHLHHDWQSDESVSIAISKGIAVLTNTPPTELDPLHDAVDSDALNRLYRPPTTHSRDRSGGHTKFRANECDVVVHSKGKIEISPPDDGT